MFKTLSTLFVTTLLSSNIYASNLTSCVAQVLKNNSNGATAHVVLACGSKTLSIHKINEFKTMSPFEIQSLKNDLLFTTKELLNTNESLNCFESESELFWVGICHKL